MREAVIVAGARTAVGKAYKGALRYVRPEDMGAVVIQNLLARVPQVQPEIIDDLVVGCSFPEGEQGMNLGRILTLRAELPLSVSGYTVNRFCSSGLNAIALAAGQIISGQGDIILAGGVESMSAVPGGGNKLAPNPWLMENLPSAYLGNGLTAENVAQRYGITREEQDAFALDSHRKAAAAIQEGKFKPEIVPLTLHQGNTETIFDTDEGPRPDSTLEGLAKLKPAFHVKGTVTAGNSSQTSDGAAFVLMMAREKAEELGLKPLAVFKTFAVGGVHPDEMGIGPVVAIPKALSRAGLSMADIKVLELNEAFASQSLYVIKQLGINPDTVNPNGGAIALGHPLGCTGVKLTINLINELQRQGGGYGMVSMCIAGGMGAAGIFQVL